MARQPDVDIGSILIELREKTRGSDAPKPTGQQAERCTGPASGGEIAELSQYDILSAPFRSHRRILGKFIILMKNFARELLVQIFERQVKYNQANSRVASVLTRNVDRLSRTVSEIHQQLTGLRLELRQSYGHSIETLESRIVNEHLSALHSELTQNYEQSIEALESKIVDQNHSTLQTLESKIVNEHLSALQVLESKIVNEHISSLRRELTQSYEESIKPFQSKIAHELHGLKCLVLDEQRRLAILLEEARKTLPDAAWEEKTRQMVQERDHMLDSFYLTLEDQFRGTREDIKRRLEVYLPYVTGRNSEEGVLDIGCGRGEFLELLREKAVRAEGVDFNRVLVERCREMGLEVAEAEALAFLRQRKANSYAVVSAIHVVEHLPFRALIALLDEVLRVLRPGGLAIFETPNPENVLVGSVNFYTDPTHRKPLPSPLMQFLVEMRGFCHVEVLKLHPYPDHYKLDGSPLADRLNELLYGPQDYAVLAYKV
jgi:2-polyprenyl-3-methyl-5-hydroxy-6-metoxy-1,4-benzoquinol methylase